MFFFPIIFCFPLGEKNMEEQGEKKKKKNFFVGVLFMFMGKVNTQIFIFIP